MPTDSGALSAFPLLPILRLLQLADSALPVGANAHSWGLETLVQDGLIRAANLEAFLVDYLLECGRIEGAFCVAAHQLNFETVPPEGWLAPGLSLNRQLSALKPSREGRAASATLGRRLFTLALSLEDRGELRLLLECAEKQGVALHYAFAFGVLGKLWGCDLILVIGALLHQMLTGALSACQRLLLLGQTQVSQILWRLKPQILQLAETLQGELAQAIEEHEGSSILDRVNTFTPQIDGGGMRHAWLDARMFVS